MSPKATPNGDSKKSAYTVRSGLVKEYVEGRHNKQLEQRERWLAEHLHCEAIEKNLRDVGRFTYEPVDYVRQLVKEPFKEPPRTDFSQTLPERMTSAERKFRRPVNVHWALMALTIVGFAVFPSPGTLIVCSVLLLIVGLSQFRTLQERQNVLTRTEKTTRVEIEALLRAEEAVIEEHKRQHEQQEDERIEYHVRLLNGDTGAMVLKLDESLPLLRFPFPLNITVDIFDRILSVRVWLPSKSVIPLERTMLNETGRIEYTKKDSLEINKQFAELSAAVLMQLIMTAFSVLPNIYKGYFKGLSVTADGREECLIAVTTDRHAVERAARANTALAAVQALAGKYVCDEFLKLMPVKADRPSEWAEVSEKDLRNLHIKLG